MLLLSASLAFDDSTLPFGSLLFDFVDAALGVSDARRFGGALGAALFGFDFFSELASLVSALLDAFLPLPLPPTPNDDDVVACGGDEAAASSCDTLLSAADLRTFLRAVAPIVADFVLVVCRFASSPDASGRFDVVDSPSALLSSDDLLGRTVSAFTFTLRLFVGGLEDMISEEGP